MATDTMPRRTRPRDYRPRDQKFPLPPKASRGRRRGPFVPDPSQSRCPETNKLSYKSQKSAANAIADIMLHGSMKQKAYRTYKCPHCGAWHTSSQPRRDNQ